LVTLADAVPQYGSVAAGATQRYRLIVTGNGTVQAIATVLSGGGVGTGPTVALTTASGGDDGGGEAVSPCRLLATSDWGAFTGGIPVVASHVTLPPPLSGLGATAEAGADVGCAVYVTVFGGESSGGGDGGGGGGGNATYVPTFLLLSVLFWC